MIHDRPGCRARAHDYLTAAVVAFCVVAPIVAVSLVIDWWRA